MAEWRDEPGVVHLPDGRNVRGAGIREPRGQVPPPDFAVYLLGRDPHIADWPALWVRWGDFRLPRYRDDAITALREAHDRAATERVEIACGGGLGRTGTAIAILARMSGVPASDAVAWTRTHYRPRAVETPWQRAWAEQASTVTGS